MPFLPKVRTVAFFTVLRRRFPCSSYCFDGHYSMASKFPDAGCLLTGRLLHSKTHPSCSVPHYGFVLFVPYVFFPELDSARYSAQGFSHTHLQPDFAGLNVPQGCDTSNISPATFFSCCHLILHHDSPVYHTYSKLIFLPYCTNNLDTVVHPDI